MFEYTGAIHIHSTYSDGTGKIEDIAHAAKDSGLDFIMMTDHNTLRPREDGYERWLNDVMVIIGFEINDTDNKNHYLAFGASEVPGAFIVLDNGELGSKLLPKEYVRLINEQGGFGFIAHPDEERGHIRGHSAYPWTQWDIEEFTGIEIWNHMSEWIEGMNDENTLQRFLHPLKTIISPPQKTLKRWDILSQQRHITAIGSVDAHAFRQNVLGFLDVEVFAYKILFKSIRTHVLVEEEILKNDPSTFEQEKQKILNSLRSGRCFIANYYHGDAKGFRFFAEYKGDTYNMGDTINVNNKEKITLRALVPKLTSIRLIHNGNMISETTAMNNIWDIRETGVYRVECWQGNKGWIFSNHIRVNNNGTIS
ncbi:MAG: CehA/McbA family metallohydrolase [Ignavibacteria bacterium]|jgi:hypothetical protein